VLRLTGSPSTIVQRPLPEDDPVQRLPDLGLAEALLGWRAATDLETGLRATIESFRCDPRIGATVGTSTDAALDAERRPAD